MAKNPEPHAANLSLLAWEQKAWAAGHWRVAGIDEAGRGPLAGDVVVAAVHFSPAALGRSWKGLTDSKQLTEARREAFFEALVASEDVIITVARCTPKRIDEINILQATWEAMREAAAGHAESFLLVDGKPVPDLPWESENIIKGDRKSLSIAAASVVAKVTRDREMAALARQYPEYGFEQHKGYGTKKHLEALRKHGPCKIHRQSFRPVREAGEFDSLFRKSTNG